MNKDREHYCRVIAIGNNKGGVGKTITAVSLASGLYTEGKRVLLIDVDPQGNSTIASGLDADGLDVSLATVMGHIINDQEFESDYGIIKTNAGYDLMPGNIELSEMEVLLVNTMARERVIKRYVTKVECNYDYILFDCGPSLGLLTTNAFAASDSVLIPVQASYMPVKGLEKLVSHIMRVKRHINPELQIEGILITLLDSRCNFGKAINQFILDAYGNDVKIFSKPIPRATKADESTGEGKSIFEYDPKGKVSEAYRALVKEVIAHE